MVAIDPKSPYIEITQQRISAFKPRFERGSPPFEVAKVILEAIRLEKPAQELRYMVGDDAFKLMEIRNNRSDKEFGRLVMESVLK
jgi:hypothetical protein